MRNENLPREPSGSKNGPGNGMPETLENLRNNNVLKLGGKLRGSRRLPDAGGIPVDNHAGPCKTIGKP